jgi:hypothetical protein
MTIVIPTFLVRMPIYDRYSAVLDLLNYNFYGTNDAEECSIFFCKLKKNNVILYMINRLLIMAWGDLLIIKTESQKSSGNSPLNMKLCCNHMFVMSAADLCIQNVLLSVTGVTISKIL